MSLSPDRVLDTPEVRTRNLRREAEINTFNNVYQRMTVAVAPIVLKSIKGEHINDREREVRDGWESTTAGISLLTGNDRVNPTSPLPGNLQRDVFIITYQDPNTKEDHEVKGSVPVEYMIDHVETEIGNLRGRLIGQTDRRRRREILREIFQRQDELRDLNNMSVPFVSSHPEIIEEAVKREAALSDADPARSRGDSVQNWLKGEKIIKKERRELKLSDGSEVEAYVDPWGRLSWEDVEAAFGKPKKAEKLPLDIPISVMAATFYEGVLLGKTGWDRKGRLRLSGYAPLAVASLAAFILLLSVTDKLPSLPNINFDSAVAPKAASISGANRQPQVTVTAVPSGKEEGWIKSPPGPIPSRTERKTLPNENMTLHKIEVNETIKGLLKAMGQRAYPEKSAYAIDRAASVLLWVIGADNDFIPNLDKVNSGDVISLRASLLEVMGQIDPEDPLIDVLDHVPDNPDAQKEAKRLAVALYEKITQR